MTAGVQAAGQALTVSAVPGVCSQSLLNTDTSGKMCGECDCSNQASNMHTTAGMSGLISKCYADCNLVISLILQPDTGKNTELVGFS